MRDVDNVIAPILSDLKEHDPGDVLGFYLYGSATTTGLRPDSDLDCLVLTSLVVSDLTPLGVHPTCDFQYGEWNREHLVQGELPQPTPDPDVVSIIATAHSSHCRLLGSDLDALVPPRTKLPTSSPRLFRRPIGHCWRRLGTDTAEPSRIRGTTKRTASVPWRTSSLSGPAKWAEPIPRS